MDKLPRYGVIGNPVAHSLSPSIHQQFAKQVGRALVYEKIEADFVCFEQTVRDFFDQGGCGLNVTLPFKIQAFELAAVKTARAMQAGAANTLWMHEGVLHADNTDGVGLICDLNRFISLEGKAVLLLGAGGAARGVLGALLAERPASITVSNRTFSKVAALQRAFPQIIGCEWDVFSEQYDCIINATSGSLYGTPLMLSQTLLENHPFCYDLAYVQHGKTAFEQWALEAGCATANGFGMLVEQAAQSFELWHGLRVNTAEIR